MIERRGASTEEVTLDPQMVPIVEQSRRERAGAPPFASVPVAAMRKRAREQFLYWNAAPPPVAKVLDFEMPGAFGPVQVRRYDPAPHRHAQPALVYFHGGGWVIGDLDLEDTALRHLANDAGAVVFSVDYALAPEHRFPGPLRDCVAVTRALHASATTLGVDPARMAIGGASAGANLAVATAMELRDDAERWLRMMLLFYGVYSANDATESCRLFGGGEYGLDAAMMERFWTLYLEHPGQRVDPRVAPLLANLAWLPPTLLVAAGVDPLRDDSLALCERLVAAGVPARCQVYEGVVHGFTLMSRELEAARRALRDAGTALGNALR
jgi:acetyl esterase